MANLLPGSEVYARGLRWEIVLAQSLGKEQLYRLRCLEGVMRDQEIDLLHPFETIEPIIHDLQPGRAAPVRNWLVYHQAFLLEQALGPNAILAVQPGRLRIEPYQLVPVIRAIRMSRVRLMLADGVGLGKTIQAGLIITELIARRIAHRVLIVSPAGPLLDQWKMEMSERFGLRFDVIDRPLLDQIRRSTELGANPFDYIPLGLASVDFLKQERILDQLDRTSYDVIIIDEAHHCTEASTADQEQSLRRRLARTLSRQCDCLMLLTATPHDGYDRSFASLLELLDPSLVNGRGEIRGERYKDHVVRRLKKHVPGFQIREVTPIPVTASPETHKKFVELQRGLLDLIAPELRRAFRSRRFQDVLAFIALLKRSVSTVEACKSTLTVVAERFNTILAEGAESQESRRQRLKTIRDYYQRMEKYGAATGEEEEEKNNLEAEDIAQNLAALQREIKKGSRDIAKVANVVEALDTLIELADEATKHDPKIEQMIAEIATIRKAEPRANILIYTEYVTSQIALKKALEHLKLGDILTMSGEDDDKDRKKITDIFRTRDNVILVSTDAASEGLNLHQRCHHLIHLELPFNPNRLEQRNGRIDRYGQTKTPIVKYLFLRGTFEERIFLRLIAKYERQRARLTFVPNTLGVITATENGMEKLLKGFMDEDEKLFKQQETLFDFTSGEEDKGADPATRELLEEIERSLQGYEKAAKSHSWLQDAGISAEKTLSDDAQAALSRGNKTSSTDLARFVVDAILLDGGELIGDPAHDVFSVKLPVHWEAGEKSLMEDLPGYDPDARLVRLTTNLDTMRDDRDRTVGYLGRAHPLVRKALDRVRNYSYGGAAQHNLDNRASAVKAAVSEPTLIYTFLGQVISKHGPEFERVIAVSVTAKGKPRLLDDPQAWLDYADPNKAIATKGVWEKHFHPWADGLQNKAEDQAASGFEGISRAFVAELQTDLASQQARQKDWARERAGEIIEVKGPQLVQAGLFDESTGADGKPVEFIDYSAIHDPIERLSAFARDKSQPIAARSEAEGVLRIYQQRMEELQNRLAIEKRDVKVLGVLMLVPEAGHGA